MEVLQSLCVMLYGVEPERGLYFKENISLEDAFEFDNDKEKPQIEPEEEGEEHEHEEQT